jgi:hypothetical protein
MVNTLILAFWHWLLALKSIIKIPKCGLLKKKANKYFFFKPQKGIYDRGIPIPYNENFNFVYPLT